MSIHLERLERLQKGMEQEKMDYLLLSPSSDFLYLTGYSISPSKRLTLCVVPVRGQPLILIPAFELPGFLKNTKLPCEPILWKEDEDPVKRLTQQLGYDRKWVIGVNDALPSVYLLQLQQSLPQAQFVQASDLLSSLRIQKDSQEIQYLQELGRRMDRVFANVCQLKFSGRTEAAVGYEIFHLVKEEGLHPVLPGGVASGPNSSFPHHESGHRVIKDHDVLWIELGQGGHFYHYQADKTRVFVVQSAPEGFLERYRLCQEAFFAALGAIRPGLSCEEVDAVARRVITAGGDGDLFTHRLGHGLGLDIHEPPYLVAGNKQPLQEGMVFSVEPGIYLPDSYGIRIEDIVYVTGEGACSIYGSTKDYVLVE